MIGYGCCVGSWDKFAQNIGPRLNGAPIIALDNQRSISVAYNTILDRYVKLGWRNWSAIILIHDDLEMIDPDTVAKVLDVIYNDVDVALVGVAGGGRSMNWWNIDPIGYQMTDSGPLHFGDRRTGEVDMIEGSFMAFSPWALTHLRFDEHYEFLGYDDVCLSARRFDKKVVVANIDTHHHTTLGFKSPQVRDMWMSAEKYFNKKWRVEK